jgi:Pregnancy-associated plasma protein-A
MCKIYIGINFKMKNHNLIILFIFLSFVANSQEKSLKDVNQELDLKVVFHIVHKNVNGNKVKINNKFYDKTAIEYLAKKLNEGFNNVDTTKIEKDYRSIVANSKINFELPTQDEDCNPLKAITFHKTSKNYFIPFVTDYQLKIKKNGLINQKKYINVWFCELDDVSNFYDLGGYTLSNGVFKGIVLNINSINDGSAIWLINHEIGHYLGLKHIWGNNCSTDDGISDTPNQKKEHKLTDIPVNIQTECGNSTKITNYQNFMDYSYNVGMFTLGQKNKMRKTILERKSELLDKINCNNQTSTIYSKKDKMNKFNFNYYTLSANNLKFKENTKYLDEFIKLYKEINPTSEFHLKRLREELKEELQHKVNTFDYSKKYQSDYDLRIGEYDFIHNYFHFKSPKTLYRYGYYTLLDEFKIIGKGYGGLTFGFFNLYAVNYKDFNHINISEKEAELFLSKLNQRKLYITIEYSLLKLPLVDYQKIVSMLGYVEKIYLFSDKEKTNLVHTLKPKNQKNYYAKYKYAIITGSTLSPNINYKFY